MILLIRFHVSLLTVRALQVLFKLVATFAHPAYLSGKCPP
jgi:hypothetical protein